MNTVQKIFTGFTIIALAATLVASAYTATIFQSASSGIANIYTAVKH